MRKYQSNTLSDFGRPEMLPGYDNGLTNSEAEDSCPLVLQLSYSVWDELGLINVTQLCNTGDILLEWDVVMLWSESFKFKCLREYK